MRNFRNADKVLGPTQTSLIIILYFHSTVKINFSSEASSQSLVIFCFSKSSNASSTLYLLVSSPNINITFTVPIVLCCREIYPETFILTFCDLGRMASRESRGRGRIRGSHIAARFKHPGEHSQQQQVNSLTPPPPYPTEHRHVLVLPSPSLKPHHEIWPHMRQVISAIYNIFAFVNERVCNRPSAMARLIYRVGSHGGKINQLTEQVGHSPTAAICGYQHGTRCPSEIESLRATVDRISQVLHRTDNELQRLQGVLNGAACVLAFERPLPSIEAHSSQLGSTLRLE
jgi:hypothetical protein